ncbi:MAG: hypothetical protein HKP58_03185 [Desulfatitalea sp.]|nr:hypothetical protein [Desulfatitalea sp.]NNJ99396.1 hypothetical protein [Desulfatitalea sp.]
MGEIKSTLDLVMERTRHLSLSEQDKAEQQREAFGKRLQGLLLQYADGVIPVDDMPERIGDLQAKLGQSENQPVVAALFERIDPDQEFRLWILLASKLVPEHRASLEKVLASYQGQKAALLAAARERQQAWLYQQHGIQGSAVVGNPIKAPQCQQQLDDLKKAVRAELAAIAAG